MRILVLHSRYLSGAASGENRVVDDEVRLLREAGDDARLWAPMMSREWRPSRAGFNAVWSQRASEQVRALIAERPPDVVHCHNLFPMLSPAVLRVAEAKGVPVVMTLHNYRLLCLPATLLRDGRICEACLGRLPWRGVSYGCYRGSHLASAALATSLSVHRALRTFDRVKIFLAVSDFVRSKHLEAGLPAARLRVKPNFAWPAARRNGSGDYFLFLGRLSPEKGMDTLLRAWRDARASLVVVGDGPEGPRLRPRAPRGVEFRGSVDPQDVSPLLARARALLVPSRSYDGAPRAILEAFAAGVPVIASDIGGLPELVEDGLSGLLVTPDDPTAWSGAVERLMDDAESERLGEGAWRSWRDRYSPERGLAELEAAYRAALNAEPGS